MLEGTQMRRTMRAVAAGSAALAVALSACTHHITRATRWGVPSWIGEFNRFGKSDAPPLGWPQQMTQYLGYLRTHDIGWCYWAITGVDGLTVGATGAPNLELVAAVQTGL